MNYTQTDINVRLQLIGCKYAEMVSNYANDLKYGRKCATTNKKNLLLIEAYIEMIECYSVCTPVEEVLSTATLTITEVNMDGDLGIRITPSLVPITGATATSNDIFTFMQQLVTVTNILTPTSGITAKLSNTDPPIIIFTGSCHNIDTEIAGNDITFNFVGFSGGVCPTTCPDTEPCITEEELDDIFDNISKLTGLCFQPKGFDYTLS